MPRKRELTREDYEAFYQRVQQAFSPEEMTEEALAEWLQSDSHPLIDQFALIKIINDQINESETLEEVKILRGEITKLPLHRFELGKRLDKKKKEIQITLKEIEINRTITIVNNFAKERGIVLDEKTKGGIYPRWGRYKKEAVVIFKNGKIKAWKYLK